MKNSVIEIYVADFIGLDEKINEARKTYPEHNLLNIQREKTGYTFFLYRDPLEWSDEDR